MGYTHYWYQRAPIRDADWQKIKFDTIKLIAAAPCKLAYRAGDSRPPYVGMDLICFNGATEEDSCEPFRLEPFPKNAFRPDKDSDEAFNFCKTRCLPYDIVVCGVLAIARAASPTTIRVDSDGNESYWKEALDWASRVLGYRVLWPVGDYATETRTPSTPA